MKKYSKTLFNIFNEIGNFAIYIIIGTLIWSVGLEVCNELIVFKNNTSVIFHILFFVLLSITTPWCIGMLIMALYDKFKKSKEQTSEEIDLSFDTFSFWITLVVYLFFLILIAAGATILDYKLALLNKSGNLLLQGIFIYFCFSSVSWFVIFLSSILGIFEQRESSPAFEKTFDRFFFTGFFHAIFSLGIIASDKAIMIGKNTPIFALIFLASGFVIKVICEILLIIKMNKKE